MDVSCIRCKTEYEFDDALISERGTSVKCTNCGCTFRIYPSQGRLAPELWAVKTGDGRQLTFGSLRELQQSITNREVGPGDILSRGEEPARPLGAIAELESFFGKNEPPERKRAGTLHGVAPPSAPPREARGETPPTEPAAAAPAEPEPEAYDGPVESLSGFEAAEVSTEVSAPVPGERQRRSTRPLGSLSLEPPRFAPVPPAAPAPAAATGPEPAPDGLGDFQPVEPRPRYAPPHSPPTSRAPVVASDSVPASWRGARDSFPDDDEPIESRFHGVHRRVSARWIAGVIIASVVVLFGATVGRKYLAQYSTARQKQEARDNRVTPLLDQGRRLLDEGDLEGAKEALDKASALAENDAQVLTALARYETIRADLAWLKLLLLDTDDELLRAARQDLEDRTKRAAEAQARALRGATQDPAFTRARVDLARLQGRLDDARRGVGPIAASAHLPENAYVLAALDIADATPVWSSVLERLRTAAAGEREVSRARVALIYALVRAGEADQAALELEKVRARGGALIVPELGSFVRRHAGEPDAGAVEEAAAPGAAPAPAVPTVPTGPAPSAGAAASGDFRTQLKEADRAVARGDVARAERLYRDVLAKHPNNTEALSGLADVAERRNDSAGAANMYDRVLANNPTYLPALIARADQKWSGGDRPGAIQLYRRVLDQVGPDTPYGQHAMQRINSNKPPAAKTADAAAAPEPTETDP